MNQDTQEAQTQTWEESHPWLSQLTDKDDEDTLGEVISHLSNTDNCEVELTLEVSAHTSDGFSQGTVRTVSENCSTLHVDNFGFEN